MSLPTYRGYPVLTWRPDWQGVSLGTSFEQTKARWDAGTGPIRDDNPYDVAPRTRRRIRYVFKSRETTRDAEAFILNTCQGRLKPFWLSTWSPDVRLTAPCAADELELFIQWIGYDKFLKGARGRNHVAIWPQFNTLAPIFREIVDNTVESTTVEKLILDTDLGATLALKDPVTFLLLCRADSDDLIIEWQHTGGVSILEFPVIDLPEETP
jgi:hypothetical protein